MTFWHVHISFYRRYATDHAALQKVASVIVGKTSPPKEKDMTPAETEKMIAQAIWSLHFGGDHGPFTQKKYGGWVKSETGGVDDRLRKQDARITSLEKKVK